MATGFGFCSINLSKVETHFCRGTEAGDNDWRARRRRRTDQRERGRAERHRFDRFSRAIVRDTTTQFDAYRADEVARIAKQVRHLEDLAEMICRERLVQLAEAAGVY